MTTPGSSIWQPFDPSAGSLPESLSPPHEREDGPEGVVAVVASGRVAESDWGPRAALEIARQWANRGARIMLADLGLERPSLHRVAGVENGEGMSDVFLFGVSIQRIARPLDDGAFFLAPAGTVTADPAGLMAHSRWEALEEGFGSASAVLMLYVSEGEASLPGVMDRAARIILLGEESSDPSELLGSAADRLMAAVSPLGGRDEGGEDDFRFPAEEAGVGVAVPAGVLKEDDGSEEAPEASDPSRDPDEEAPAADPPADDSDVIPDRRRTIFWIFLVLVLVVVGAAAAVWFGYVEVPGLELPGSGGP